MKPSDIVIIHLSDLHFCPQFVTKLHKVFLKFPTGHDYNLLKGLENAFFDIYDELGTVWPCDHSSHPKNVIVMVTGDITTDGNQKSFNNAKDFLTRTVFYEDVPFGLNLPVSKLFVVPGNHDIWLPLSKARKNKSLVADSKSLCEVYHSYFEKRLPYWEKTSVNNLDLSILGLDSNLPVGKSIIENIVGRGSVGCDQLESSERLNREKSNSDELKIALLHHHVFQDPEIGQWMLSLQERNWPKSYAWLDKLPLGDLRLIDAKAVRERFCKMGIGMVLCGHLHHCHFAPQGEMHDCFNEFLYSCTGSATQRNLISKDGSGFENRFCVYGIKKKKKSVFEILVRWYKANERYCFKIEKQESHNIICK